MHSKYHAHTGFRGVKSKIQQTTAKLAVMAASVVAVFAVSLAPVSAAATVVYNNVPSPLPGNLSSQAFEATSTSEFGGQVSLAGTARQNLKVTVVMSSWGCQAGHWYSGDCATTPGATFSVPITLNVYNVGAGNAPGSLVTTQTQTFNVPYRPSASATCGDGRWSDGTNCYNGFATPITFTANPSVTWPTNAIVSLAYNTTHYGYAPIGEAAACYTSGGGCGYDSLNVALTASPSVGSDPLPADAYLNSTWSGAYCDNGAGGTGTFRLDSGCWTGYQPAIEIEVAAPAPPTSKDQCKNNGWQQFTGQSFKNQGDCVSYVEAHSKS